MTPLELDALAMRALRALCGEAMTARLAWARNGVELAIVRDGEVIRTARSSTLADAVIWHATQRDRDDIAAPLIVARARMSTAPTMRPEA